jgi:hypothetical protein
MTEQPTLRFQLAAAVLGWLDSPEAPGWSACLDLSDYLLGIVRASALLIEDGFDAAVERAKPLLCRFVEAALQDGYWTPEGAERTLAALLRAAVGEG